LLDSLLQETTNKKNVNGAKRKRGAQQVTKMPQRFMNI